jgi:protein-L-isoaspartate(D-aspartate) O-methyltransferase
MSHVTPFAKQREQMIEHQIKRRGIHEQAIVEALRAVPREEFVLDEYRTVAYDDTPLPIPAGQTISQPYVVALMIQSLQVDADARVLEVGSGSGYAAAILSRMVAEVHAVERHRTLVAYARERLDRLGYKNVHVHHGDGSKGWPAAAPYDGILVSASGPHIPQALKAQLAIGGHLVMPVGRERGLQDLIRLTRSAEESYRQQDLGGVRFVPLIGEEGW